MRRHVHEMASAGGKCAQAIRVRHRARGIGRGLDGVYIVGVRADMVGVLFEHGFKRAYDFERVRAGPTVDTPQAQRMQIHQRFRK